MKKMLVDKYGRQLNYLRLSVTDRCNFRCFYCMPEHGVKFASRSALLTLSELQTLTTIFCNLGVNKIRITGGEPFVRPGLMHFLKDLSYNKSINEISITTNGSLLTNQTSTLKELGINKINLSLDSADKKRFLEVTRRNSFDEVYSALFDLLNAEFEVKVNCVISNENSLHDIIPLIELTKQNKLSVRFLEAMPFNGSEEFSNSYTFENILAYIKEAYPAINNVKSESNSTSINYRVDGYEGTFGIIASYSRTFCGTCNRIRLSSTGELRTCLYGPSAANLRDELRRGATIEEIETIILDAVAGRALDGFEAESLSKETSQLSMSAIGG